MFAFSASRPNRDPLPEHSKTARFGVLCSRSITLLNRTQKRRKQAKKRETETSAASGPGSLDNSSAGHAARPL